MTDPTDPAPDLHAVEQLPNWAYGTLVAWCLERPWPDGIGADEADAMRQMQLIGTLALACEQALVLGDRRAARAMGQLCEMVLLRTKGVAALRAALVDRRED